MPARGKACQRVLINIVCRYVELLNLGSCRNKDAIVGPAPVYRVSASWISVQDIEGQEVQNREEEEEFFLVWELS